MSGLSDGGGKRVTEQEAKDCIHWMIMMNQPFCINCLQSVRRMTLNDEPSRFYIPLLREPVTCPHDLGELCSDCRESKGTLFWDFCIVCNMYFLRKREEGAWQCPICAQKIIKSK
jgi:hypothetical protein